MDDSTPPPTLENHHDAIFGNKAKRIPSLRDDVDELKAELKGIKDTLEKTEDAKKELEDIAKGRGQVGAFVWKVVGGAVTILTLASGLYTLIANWKGG